MKFPTSGLGHRVHRPPAVHPTHVASPGAINVRNAYVYNDNGRCLICVPELWRNGD